MRTRLCLELAANKVQHRPSHKSDLGLTSLEACLGAVPDAWSGESNRRRTNKSRTQHQAKIIRRVGSVDLYV